MPNFVKILKAGQLEPGQVTGVTINGRDLCLANYEGDFFALENKCPHRGGQLGDSRLQGPNVICPLHGWDFDVQTGISRYDSRHQLTQFARMCGCHRLADLSLAGVVIYNDDLAKYTAIRHAAESFSDV